MGLNYFELLLCGAIGHAIEEGKREKKAQREFQQSCDRMDRITDAEASFKRFYEALGFTNFWYIADWSASDLGQSATNEEIRKMERLKDKMQQYLNLGGYPDLITDEDDLVTYIPKLEYLKSVGYIDKQREYISFDYDRMVYFVQNDIELEKKYSDIDEEEPEEDVEEFFEPEEEPQTGLSYDFDTFDYLFGDNLAYYERAVAIYHTSPNLIRNRLLIAEMLHTALLDKIEGNDISTSEVYMICDEIQDLVQPCVDAFAEDEDDKDSHNVLKLFLAECDFLRGFLNDSLNKYLDVFYDWAVALLDDGTAVKCGIMKSIYTLSNIIGETDREKQVQSVKRMSVIDMPGLIPDTCRTVLGVTKTAYDQSLCLLFSTSRPEYCQYEYTICADQNEDILYVENDGTKVQLYNYLAFCATQNRVEVRELLN